MLMVRARMMSECSRSGIALEYGLLVVNEIPTKPDRQRNEALEASLKRVMISISACRYIF